MPKLQVIAPDSAAFSVLSSLYRQKSSMTAAQLLPLMQTRFRSIDRFDSIAAQPLLKRKLICIAPGEKYQITSEGRVMVESFKTALMISDSHPAVHRMKSMDLAKHFRYEEMRLGAHDYRSIPSLMSGERVPYCGIRGRSAE